jgi:hypothetical protein
MTIGIAEVAGSAPTVVNVLYDMDPSGGNGGSGGARGDGTYAPSGSDGGVYGRKTL